MAHSNRAAVVVALVVGVWLACASGSSSSSVSPAYHVPHLTVLPPISVLTRIGFDVTLEFPFTTPDGGEYPTKVDVEIRAGLSSAEDGSDKLIDKTVSLRTAEGEYSPTVTLGPLKLPERGLYTLTVTVYDKTGANEIDRTTVTVRAVPGWLSLLPPLITIIIAIGLRQVLLALSSGIYLGAFIIHNYNPIVALLRSLDTYWTDALGSPGNAGVILFTFLLGGLIGVVTRSGGALGLASLLGGSVTKSQRSTKLALFGLGCLIFFDDYSSILIVGNTLRTIVESQCVSREKFAFLIHGMGTCLASFSPVSSWVGVEVGYITNEYANVGDTQNPFIVFMESIPYRFFPVLMIIFVVTSSLLGRDFEPMWAYERASIAHKLKPAPSSQTPGLAGVSVQAEEMKTGDYTTNGSMASTEADFTSNGLATVSGGGDDDSSDAESEVGGGGPLDPKPDTPRRWYNAAAPFTTVVIVTFLGMYLDGRSQVLHINAEKIGPAIALTTVNIFSHSNAVNALLWSSFCGCAVAAIFVIPQKIMDLDEYMSTWIAGINDVLEPCLILTLAWGLGSVIHATMTADYLVSALGSSFPAGILPFLVAIAAYVMSFSTGSSFGTYGILFPLVVPIAARLGGGQDSMLQCVASVLGGGVFGNVCSPIADNTILACLASKCEIADHVRSQSVYVALVGANALIFGTLPVGMGWYPFWAALLICTAIQTAALYILGAPHDVIGAQPLISKMRGTGTEGSEEDGEKTSLLP